MDEMEGNGERETEARIAAMMELARGTSSQDSGGTAKANQTGGVDVQQIKSCFSFASIVPQITKRADFRRFTLLTLKVNDAPDKDEHFKKLAEAVHTLLTRKYVSGLQARTLANVKRLVANIETFSQAVSIVLGERGAGDQLGPMLAGAALLESTKLYTLDEALAVARTYETDFRTATKSMSDEEAIVHYIAQAEIRVQAGNTTVMRSVSELVDTVLHGTVSGVGTDEADRAMKAHGIAIRDKRDGIAVSASHTGIKKLLEKTSWSASHMAILSRVPGAKLLGCQRFGSGPGTKAVLLPLDVFTPADAEE
jgi:putative DNA primase/helicase